MGYTLEQNQTAQPLVFFLADSSDHIAGKTGLSPSVTISKNGGAFAPPAGAVSEIAVGWYKVAGNATDSSTLGPLLLHATASGADPVDDCFVVVAYDPQNDVLSILALLNAAGLSITLSSPVPSGGGKVVLVRGDDYRDADGRALSWSVTTGLDLSAAAVSLIIYSSTVEAAGTHLTVSCTASAISGGYALKVDLTAAQTAALSLNNKYRYELKAVLANTHVWTLTSGQIEAVQ